MNEKILVIERLKKVFSVRGNIKDFVLGKPVRFVHAVDSVSFIVHAGEILGLVGESGCGKTTLGRTILRLVEPTSGHIYFDGIDITQISTREMKAFRRKMQMIFQDPHGSLNPRRSVYEIIKQTIRIHQLTDTSQQERELIKRAVEEVGLQPAEEFINRYPVLLSGGQRQRVGIARVLVLEPKLIIADEPLSMLDISVRIGILELLLKLREELGITFIFITHDLATARYLCDRIAIMYLGAIVEMANTEEILSNPIHPYTKALIRAVMIPDPRIPLSDLPIRGIIPNEFGEIQGCRFYPRCIYGKNGCDKDEPELVEISPDHFVACTHNVQS